MRLLPYMMIATMVLVMAKHQNASAQNVSINNEGMPGHASSILDVASDSRGVLLPRMTEAQRNAIPSPAEGLLLYQTNGSTGFYVHSGGTWESLSGGAAQVDMPELLKVHSSDFLITGNNWSMVPGMSLDFTIPPGKAAKAHIIVDIGLVTNASGNNNHSCTDIAIILNENFLPDAGYKRVTAGSGSTSNHNNHIKNTVVTGYSELATGDYNVSIYAVRTCTGGNTRNAVLGGDSTSLLQGTMTVQLIYD